MSTEPSAPKPAYLISSVRILEPGRLGPFREAAAPLTRKAGAQPLVAGDPTLHVLDGTWDYKGSTLVIERYPSMADVQALWNSPEFQAARKLSTGFVEVNFVVAIEGR